MESNDIKSPFSQAIEDPTALWDLNFKIYGCPIFAQTYASALPAVKLYIKKLVEGSMGYGTKSRLALENENKELRERCDEQAEQIEDMLEENKGKIDDLCKKLITLSDRLHCEREEHADHKHRTRLLLEGISRDTSKCQKLNQ